MSTNDFKIENGMLKNIAVSVEQSLFLKEYIRLANFRLKIVNL